MNRSMARAIHSATNLAFWVENPSWSPDNAIAALACKAVRALPFSIHDTQKRLFFDDSKVIAVNGESVVAANGADQVDKFMFRYPGEMTTEDFKGQVEYEIGAVVESLAGIALATQVSIKPADIFRFSRKPVLAVTQTQARLDLAVHVPLSLPELAEEQCSSRLDKTAMDIEKMLNGIEVLTGRFGYYPDIAYSSGNLRRSEIDGSVTLIDVMPIHADGTRLIADGATVLPNTLENIGNFQAFVGQYGS